MTQLEEAQLRHEAREMYKDLGLEGCLACLTESVTFASILMEVIIEEMHQE